MKISAPRIFDDGKSVVVSADFICGQDRDTLWFKLATEYREYVETERSDAFLVGLLFYAMIRGEDIEIESTISEKLYYNLSNYLIPALTLANPKLLPIKVFPAKLATESVNIGKSVGTGFSGGIDSFCTIYEHYANSRCPQGYRLTHLTFFNTGSHGDLGGDEARVLFNKRFNILKEFPKEIGLNFIFVDSNISEVLQMNFASTHTMRNMAPVLLLQKLFRVYYYSSGYRMDDFRIIGAASDTSSYDILNTAMLSTESVNLYSSGTQYTRVEKTALISKYEPTWRYLNVCASDDHNCSSCFKCMRTLFTLELVGNIQNYSQVFDLSKYSQQRKRYIAEILYNKKKYIYRDIFDKMIKRGFSVPFRSRLIFACLFVLRFFRKIIRST